MATTAVVPSPAPAPVSAAQEPASTSVPQPVAAPAAAADVPAADAPAPVPSQAAREALYQKYYSSVPSQPEPATAPAGGGEPPAQGGPEPSEPAVPAPAEDLDQRFASFEQRILGAVQQALVGTAQQQPAAPAPNEPAAAQPASAGSAPGDWLELMRQGKLAEGERALAVRISQEIQDSIASQTLEAVRVEGELTKFVNDLRTSNQDILDLEDWIGLRARGALDTAIAANKIQSSADYIREYKAAVSTAVDDARKLAQKFRAAGKNEALTTKQQVLSASTLTPNTVDANRQPASAQEPQAESAESYLQKRIAEQLARKGIAA